MKIKNPRDWGLKGAQRGLWRGAKKLKGHSRSRKIFTIGGEFSLLANFRSCSENFVPAPAFLL